ncbi:MAG TPA: hypothetical protein VKU82_04345 [Planctomycetaceae bacterium]|nr:hypothetical protein [Planctomycetaceae bacterium]
MASSLSNLLLLIAAGSIAGLEPGQSKLRGDSKKPATESAKTIDEFKADAAGYVIKLQGRQDKLTLRDEPLLHWGNPARTGEDGAVFVWMLDGRPEVIGSVFTYRLPNAIRRKHEYHSLAAGPLTAEYRGARVWSPKTAGVTFRPIPDAPAPAETPRLRLTQMKNMARDFSARMVDLEGQQSDLRLIPQPLIRYEPKDKSILDGALFSFSIGTDPEVILLIEAREAGDRLAWHYAFARFHYVNLTVNYKDSEVWHAKALPDMTTLDIGTPKYQDSVYATYHVQTTPIVE